jgi:hypothetical protein
MPTKRKTGGEGRGKQSRGKVRVIDSEPDLMKWPPAGATDLTDVHSILGANIDALEFLDRVRGLDQETHDKITGVCSRLQLVDALQHESSFSTSWNRVQSDALQVYLLCTCLDALASRSDYRHFHEWIAQEEQQSLIEEIIAEESSAAQPSPTGYKLATGRLASKWLDEYGVSRGFRGFILGLPAALRTELTDSYAILKEPQEGREDWGGFEEDKRLRRVVAYLYELRRNTFTHQARIVPTFVPARGIAGWVRTIPPETWDYAVYFSNANELRGEVPLLRIVVIGAIRHILGYSVDEAFVDLHWKVESMRRLVRLALRELEFNDSLRCVFLRQWPVDLARAPKYARPARFARSALGKLCRSRKIDFSWFYPLTPEDDKNIRQDISTYLGWIKHINDLVERFESLALRPRVWEKTKIAAHEKIREAARDSQWTELGESIATGLYFILRSAPENLAGLRYRNSE